MRLLLLTLSLLSLSGCVQHHSGSEYSDGLSRTTIAPSKEAVALALVACVAYDHYFPDSFSSLFQRSVELNEFTATFPIPTDWSLDEARYEMSTIKDIISNCKNNEFPYSYVMTISGREFGFDFVRVHRGALIVKVVALRYFCEESTEDFPAYSDFRLWMAEQLKD